MAVKRGAVGLRLRWNQVEQAFAIDHFTPLPDGSASIAQASGLLSPGMILRAIGRKRVRGLSYEEVAEVMVVETEGGESEGKAEEAEVFLEFEKPAQCGSIGAFAAGSLVKEGDGNLASAQDFLNRLARSIEDQLRPQGSIWSRLV